MSNQINTGTIVLNDARIGGTVPLTLSFSLAAKDLDGGRALLVVYDLDQYQENQFLNGGEVGDALFTGQKTVFDRPPQHKVEAGSGILFMAEATFKARPQNAVRKTIDSFIEQLDNVSVMSSPAFKLDIRCLNSVDAQGKPLSPQVIDLRTLGQSGPAQADFDAFTKSGDSKRFLTIRLLSIDRTRVLVSQLNPQQCFANQAIKIRYDAAHPPAKVKQSAPSPAPVQVPPRRRLGDITGEYVELSDSTAQPTKPGSLLAASVLRVHHVGVAVCGWYSPLPNFVLSARLPSTTQAFGPPLFADPIPKLGTRRGVFVLGRNIPGTTRFRGEFVFRGVANSADEIDPDLLVAAPDLGSTSTPAPLAIAPAERVPVNIEFEPVDRPFEASPDRIRISFPPLASDPAGLGNVVPDVVFARISGRSRLPWAVIHNLATEAFIPKSLTQTVVPRVVEEFAESLPPAVLGALIAGLISPQMDALVIAVSQTKGNNAQIAQRAAAVDAVNTALRNLATALRSIAGNPTGSAALSPTLIAQVREVARRHVIQFEGKSTNTLSAMQIIADDVVERQIATDPGTRVRDHLATLSTSPTFDGFMAFSFLPERGFIYRLTFTDQSSQSSNFIILSGSFGAFLVQVEKLDQATEKPVEQALFPPTTFGGFFVAGAIGAGYKYTISIDPKTGAFSKAGKGQAGATIGPMSVDIVSISDLGFKDFEGAQFSIFAAGGSISGSVGPLDGSVKDIDAVFSLTTTSIPPVTLETELKKGIQPDASLVQGIDLVKRVSDMDQQLNTGKPVDVAEASVSLTVASLGVGWLVRQTSLPPPTPRPQKPTESLLQDASVEVNAVIRDAKFARQSAVLSSEMRIYLELRLAVQRKMLEYPGWMNIEGLASPEYGNLDRANAAAANNALSLHRANAVRDAIFDAAGRPGEGIIPAEKDIDVQGKGSQPFDPEFSPTPQASQHLDVFAPLPSNPAQAIAVQRDREKFLPTLRRVDIAMNGVFTLRVPGK